MLLNDFIIKNNANAIILITRLMLNFLLQSTDMLCQVLSDLDEVNNHYSYFSDARQKAPSFKSSKSLTDVGLANSFLANLQTSNLIYRYICHSKFKEYLIQ